MGGERWGDWRGETGGPCLDACLRCRLKGALTEPLARFEAGLGMGRLCLAWGFEPRILRPFLPFETCKFYIK